MSKITLDEILAVKYLQEWDWSPNGDWISYLWNDGGLVDCWLVPSDGAGAARRLTGANQKVTAAAWNPVSGTLALAIDGDLHLAEPDREWFSLRRVTSTGEVEGGLTWSQDGTMLLLQSAGSWYLLGGEELWRKLKLPGKPLAAVWAPDSRHLLLRVQDEHHRERLILADRQGELLWMSDHSQLGVTDARWVDGSRFVYQVSQDIRRAHDWWLASIAATQPADYSRIGEPLKLRPELRHLYREEQADRRGALSFSGVLPSPGGGHLLFSLEQDGWLHHYRYDLERQRMEQLTDGQCEDFGHAGDRPHWSPDGQRFVYASNRGNLIRRDLWIYDLTARSQRQLTDFPVTNVQPKWSPDGQQIAFVHCDQRRCADLWVISLEGGRLRQLTDSMPEGLADKLQVQERISYQGALDWDIDGFLLKPRDFDPNRRYPALVWVHGGPIRQLRGSWHPSYSYAHFYAVNQYLASRGYVVLSINYRGGIGYGKEFRFGLHRKMGVDDVLDVVNGGRYLKSLPYVDAAKVGVYGLSYGGYMTLHCLTQYPDEFALGVNFAGIWDYAQWSRWIESRTHSGGSQFACFFCGLPSDSPELYAQGSPVTFRENLRQPLINFHGTEDANVDFAQLNRIVEDCVQMGKTYEAYYYPGEVHMFARRRTWQDALPKLERELTKYLPQN